MCKMDREVDDRYVLTPQMEMELQNDIDAGILTRKELGIKYKVSKSKIWQMCNPKQHKKNYEARKDFQKGGRYYDREKRRKDQARYRKKLKELNETKSGKSGKSTETQTTVSNPE